MNGRVYEGDLTVPAGTPVAAPVAATVNMPVGRAAKVTLVVPDGHNGLTGVQINLAGTPIVPYAGAGYIVANNYTDSWQIDQDVNPGQFTIAGYNTDVYQHTFYIRVLWEPPKPPPAVTAAIAAPGAAPLDTSDLTAYTTDETADTGIDLSAVSVPGSPCYDADGNLVDCGDPSAVSGPVTYLPPPEEAAGGGNGTTASDESGTCYDAYGNVVDCSDPTAVSGPVLPSAPAIPPPAPPPATPPPPPIPAPVTVITPPPAARPPVKEPAPVKAGPYRHIADGTRSLDAIAKADKTTAADLTAITRAAKGMTRAELAAFNAYVRTGTGRKMHKGLAYYSKDTRQ